MSVVCACLSFFCNIVYCFDALCDFILSESRLQMTVRERDYLLSIKKSHLNNVFVADPEIFYGGPHFFQKVDDA